MEGTGIAVEVEKIMKMKFLCGGSMIKAWGRIGRPSVPQAESSVYESTRIESAPGELTDF